MKKYNPFTAMQNFTHLKALSLLAVALLFSSCDKQQDVAPSSQVSSQRGDNGNIFDYRGTNFDFPGQESKYDCLSIDLTNLPAAYGTVPMVRTNFIEAANGAKIISQWQSVVPLDIAKLQALGISLPYTSPKGFTFIDQTLYNGETLFYVFDVSFTIDITGIAKAKLTWNGAKTTGGSYCGPLPVQK